MTKKCSFLRHLGSCPTKEAEIYSDGELDVSDRGGRVHPKPLLMQPLQRIIRFGNG